MRTDTNKIALRAIRSLLGAATPFEVEAGATRVSCSMTPVPAVPWPAGLDGVTEAEDGPWPGGVAVDCRWAGGACRLLVEVYRWTAGEYVHDLCIRIRTERNREVIFVNVSNELEEAEDGIPVKLAVRFFVTKRKTRVSEEVAEALNAGMQEMLAGLQIPILGKNTAELCEVEAPGGGVQPSADVVFRRLVQLALLKLDFIDRGRTADRGAPIVDLGRWLTPEQLAAAGPELEHDDADSNDAGAASRRYWAGEFGERPRLAKFKAENYWQIGWKRDSDKPAAQRTWKRFAGIGVGDYFAIKGIGGASDLVVHYVGEVVAVDAQNGKLALRPLPITAYRGKAPTGKGAGNWQDTLVPIKRPDIIELVFGGPGTQDQVAEGSVDEDVATDELPLNLILYGPPGTGKTHHLTHDLIGRFQRKTTKADVDAALAEELTWTHVAAVALHEAGGSAKVATLEQHPLIRAKYATGPMKAPLRKMLWGVLQTHTIESSKTVGYKARAAEQLFNKKEDSTWMLATALPEELRDVVKERKAPLSSSTLDDFTFVTFHQAYGYEDFIEGIRPRVDASGDGDDGTLSYSLEDGAFMKAVRAALRLASYDGSLHELCGLTRDEREQQFAKARPYAVFIDEINRGNVARIFGELITLLEDDKRLGEDNEVIVQLPYSQKRFGVPPNLHVIGTMNTADRSIEALDTALRRRFEFKELPPDLELLDFDIEGDIEPDKMLQAINLRLEKLYDRDHRIGHAYLYGLRNKPTLEGLRRVFRNKLIPLLQEYFHADWGKIGLVLGRDFVRKRDISATPFAKFEHDDHDTFAASASWEFVDVDKLSNVAFQRIYKDVPDA